jgi:hypothetical protein
MAAVASVWVINPLVTARPNRSIHVVTDPWPLTPLVRSQTCRSTSLSSS